VVPAAVCCELYQASGGWPGIVDRLALLAIARADRTPIEIKHVEHPSIPESTRQQAASCLNNGPSVPLLTLTHSGKLLKEIKFTGTRILIGRSEHNDLSIDSKFVSRHHALLVRHDTATLLMDLNSSNGTFVNSRRVSNQVLANNDVMSFGEHRLKFIDPTAQDRQSLEGFSFNETVVMKTLDDMRRVLARETTEILPVQREGSDASSELN
jgi:pSer/pThr/pTyr-binding forkhead associated (FHA) protein